MEDNKSENLFEEDFTDLDIEDEDDIEFDDDINIAAITQQLQNHVNVTEVSDIDSYNKPAEDVEPVNQDIDDNNTVNNDMSLQPVDSADENSVDMPVNTKDKMATLFDEFPKSECKKYVVYIIPENISYVDELSIDDRTRFINEIIKEKKLKDTKKTINTERVNYLKHLSVVFITAVIAFPLIFFIVNKSLQASISNYKQGQENIQKLYKERGKIKQYKNLSSEK